MAAAAPIAAAATLVAAAAAALVALAVVVATAAATLVDMLVTLVVAMAVAIAGGTLDLLDLAGEERLDECVAVARATGIDGDPSLVQRVDGTATDAAADERVDAALRQDTREGTVPGTVGAHDLRGDDLALLHVIDIELLGLAKLLEDVAVIVRDRNPHDALSLCRPRLGVVTRS